MLKCAECMKDCVDRGEWAALAAPDGWYACHNRCVNALLDKVRDQRPYEQFKFPPECWLTADDLATAWRSTLR